MGRSFYSAVMRTARAIDRANRAAARSHERRMREQAREQAQFARESARMAKLVEKEARLQYLEDRQAEVNEMNEGITERVGELRNLLLSDPKAAQPIDLRSLRQRAKVVRFQPGREVGPEPKAPREEEFRTEVKALGWVSKLFGGKAKHDEAVRTAQAADQSRFAQASEAYAREHQAWSERSAAAMARHEREQAALRAEVDRHNAAVEAFEAAYRAGEPEAVMEYFSLVLNRSDLPEGFPEEFRIAYVPESKQLVVEHRLPTRDVVPAVSEYTYQKSKDEIKEKPRKKAEADELYRHLVASVALRVLNEMLGSDDADVLGAVVFNGVVRSVSPATGEEVEPCVVSVRATRDEFRKLNLERVEPAACLKALGAVVSRKPEELAAVRPVIEFDMVDRRFVAEDDVLSTLEGRPNIMDLTPAEFEALVTNLFTGMGLEAKLTRSSKDGGVDTVAFDPRPVFGGKIVIQAKRYKNTVGISVVRDLYGTMQHEGANKGILITTAGYGQDAYAWAKDKPVELIDGSGLLFLLEQQGRPARIVMPQ
jgi:restriction system protein